MAAGPAPEHATLCDGSTITVRAARPDDRERVARAFAALDRESVYTRFFTYKRDLSAAELADLDTLDFIHDAIFFATVEAAEGETIVGACRYVAEPDARSAEIAFTIEEDWQGRGIAGRLLERLVRLARENGIARFDAIVLAGNTAMLRVFERAGLPTTTRREDGQIAVTLAL